MKIIPIIINGRHGGQLLQETEYSPKIRIPIKNENQISIGEKYDKSVRIGDFEEYKECFRSVDGDCVMYSTNGRWDDVKYALLYNLDKTYPIEF